MTEYRKRSQKVTTRKILIVLFFRFFLFASGAIFGLVVLGWWLWPVKWTNISPNVLDRPYQVTYITMVADSYSTNQNAILLQERVASWNSSELAILLSEAKVNSEKAGDLKAIQNIDAVAQVLGQPTSVVPAVEQPITIPPTEPEQIPWIEMGRLSLITFLITFFFVSLTAGALRFIVVDKGNNNQTVDMG